MSLKIRKSPTRGTHKTAPDVTATQAKPRSAVRVRASDNARVAEEIAAAIEKARSRGGGKVEDVFCRVPSTRGC